MIDKVVAPSSSPSAVYCFAPDEHLSSKQRTTGVSMNFSKRTDVKNHLSRRIRKNIFPFRPATEPDSQGYSIEEQNRSSTRTPRAVFLVMGIQLPYL
jgi:hypothetical protein